MSAFQQAVLAVDPERLEKFSIEMKKNIRQKPKSKRKSPDDKNSRTKRRQKHSNHEREKAKSSKSSSSNTRSENKNSSDRKRTSSHSRSKDHKHERSTPSKAKRPKKFKSKNSVDESDFDPKDLDLSVPLSPLTELVKDRKLLLDTVFAIIKGPKLTSMLPDILKLMPLEEIKKLCGEQLDVMSSKRVLHTLSGTVMVSSSGTDSSDNEEHDCQPAVDAAEALPLPIKQEHSLQANFVDSTTSDQPSVGPSMLFPSALSTAQATMINQNTLGREIVDDDTDQDSVSTSTQPNFIYMDDLSHSSSDTEEGEVQTSDEEHEIVEPEDDVIVVQDDQEENNPNEEDVLVEVEELLDEDYNNKLEDAAEHSQPNKNRRKVSVKKVRKQSIDSPQTSKLPKNSDSLIVEDSTRKDDDPSEQNTKVENSSDPHAGKSQLEILELELRARAIRSLMKAAQSGKLKPITK
uniref:LOW QUALITY PROTEIN: caspase activity and apoptosis inhibitor 1-like n=1 Tax=Styela clava TaxID=7725 RepID=UPI001939D7D3|nr:LOW QUALITY PROTEIN: caspase activity and apoptosis inhibitor 1-like [Styela clava]